MGSDRRFELHRDRDVSGVSGLGVVADGAQFAGTFAIDWPDGSRTELEPGWCLVRWRGEHSSTVVWPALDGLIAVNGHGGATRVVWLDEYDTGGVLSPGLATAVNNTGVPEPVLFPWPEP